MTTDPAARITNLEGLRYVDPSLVVPLRRLIALSQANRLELLRLLLAAGPEGRTHQSLVEQMRLRRGAITLHLRILAEAGLIDVDTRVVGDRSLQKAGALRCVARVEELRDLVAFLTEKIPTSSEAEGVSP